MLDLSQLFIEGGTSDLSSSLTNLTVHELIVIDEIALGHFDNLYRNDQRDGNHGVDEYEIGKEMEDSINGSRIAPLNVVVRC